MDVRVGSFAQVVQGTRGLRGLAEAVAGEDGHDPRGVAEVGDPCLRVLANLIGMPQGRVVECALEQHAGVVDHLSRISR